MKIKEFYAYYLYIRMNLNKNEVSNDLQKWLSTLY